jgi:chondroitin 4-sulfotransferase 11
MRPPSICTFGGPDCGPAWSPFVFIHINKTGGTSVSAALGISIEHKTAEEKRNEIGQEDWLASYKFAFVRDPWDRVVSHYHYRVRTDQTALGDGHLDFRSWVAATYGRQDPRYFDKPMMFMPQYRWIYSETGTLQVDFVGRYESLQRDFEHVCRRLGRAVSLPHLKRSRHAPYDTYYDESTQEIVADWFRPDLELFGYRWRGSQIADLKS